MKNEKCRIFADSVTRRMAILHSSFLILHYINKNSIGMRMPIISSTPPRPHKPFGPFTIHMPVSVIRMRHTANMSAKQVHQLPGLK